MDAWVVEALRVGYRIPFDRLPPLSECPLSLPAYSPQSIRGVALTQELQNLLRKGAVEPAPQSPGFYSRLFLVQKASGSWRPIIDLSTLNDLHHLGTLPHGDSSVSPEFHPPRRLDDLPGPARRLSSGSSASRFASFPSLRGSRKDLPVQGPLFRSYNRASSLHEDYGTSVRYPPQARGQNASLPGRLAHPGLYGNRLHSVKGQAPISLQRTRHPGQLQEVVSSAHSVSSVLRHGDSISAFYRSSHTSTSQQSRSPYRGVLVNPVSSGVPLASPARPPVFSDSSRLGRDDLDEASSALDEDQWDFLDDQFQVAWSPLCREDLLWWSRVVQLREGVSLSLPAPDISFFSDASDVGWGALVGEHHASGLWSPHQKALSINMRELLAVQLGLQAFELLLVGMSVALFCDNTTTVAYLRCSGGTFSATLNATAREILLWAKNRRIRLLPQFIMGSSNVTADALSRPIR